MLTHALRFGTAWIALSLVVVACSDAPSPAPGNPLVFSGEENRLNVYDPSDGFKKQTFPSNSDDPGIGRDLNGQICFQRDADGVHFILGEDSNQGSTHDTAGWGYFRLTGTEVGSLQYEELGKLTPTYQFTPDEAENYGCGFLKDGRLLTTDVGNQAAGPGNGQLIIWFPPFDTGIDFTTGGVLPVHPAHYCKLDVAIGTAGSIYVDSEDRVYVASARVSPAIYRYTGPFPTSDDAAGGCGQVDDTGAPLADHVNKEVFIAPDSNVSTPNAIIPSPVGTFYVSSVFSGVIGEYDANGVHIRNILQPPAGETVGPKPFSTGSPLGLGIDASGTVYYADIGIIVTSTSVGPGDSNGTVRRIRFIDNQPQPPEIMDTGLDFPDGIGVLQ